MTIIPNAVYVTPLGRLARALPMPTTGHRACEDAHPFEYVDPRGKRREDGFYLRWINLSLLRPANGERTSAERIAA